MATYKDAKGVLSAKEREFLHSVASQGDVILNVGVEFGASVHCFQEGNPKCRIIAIDIIGGEQFEGKRDRVTFIKADTLEVDLDFGEVDISFIDGSHYYHIISEDIKKFAPITKKLMVFHDYSELPWVQGVVKALDEWKTDEWKKIKQVDTIAVYERVEC